MATLSARLAKIEAQVTPEIQADVRDPELVEMTQRFLGEGFPEERIPCGISAAKFMRGVLRDLQGKCRPLPVCSDEQTD